MKVFLSDIKVCCPPPPQTHTHTQICIHDDDDLHTKSQLSDFIGVLQLLHNMNIMGMKFEIMQNVAKTSV
jgi:hypothetical protein